MKYIKRALSLLLLGALLLSAVSCGLIYIPDDDRDALAEVLPELFTALDNGDNDKIYALFSPAVREQCGDLQEQIFTLVAVCGRPTDEFELEKIPLESSEHIGEDGSWKSTSATIPVRSGNDYYWFYIDLMYENDDSKQVGITQLEFFTADERCAFLEGGNRLTARKGLYLHTEKHLDCEIRAIESRAHRYTTTTRTIDVDHVKEFLAVPRSISEFIERFGEPNAKSSSCYYELPKENGEPRYLEINDYNKGSISIARIVDDFKLVEVIWKKE